MSNIVYKASCWDCEDFYVGKTKRRVHDRKTEHFKALTKLVTYQPLQTTLPQLVTTLNGTIFTLVRYTFYNKDTLLIHDLQPALNENVGSEKLYLYYFIFTTLSANYPSIVCFLISYQSLTLHLNLLVI